MDQSTGAGDRVRFSTVLRVCLRVSLRGIEWINQRGREIGKGVFNALG